MWRSVLGRNIFNLCSKPITPNLHSQHPTVYSLIPYQIFSLNSSYGTKTDASPSKKQENLESSCDGKNETSDFPSGEFEFKKRNGWDTFLFKVKMLFALPWLRVPNGSVLTIKLRGKISDQLTSPISSELSLPQICDNLIKAAHDPRISGVYLHVDTLNCGWGKIEEIRRHILDFKKSGKIKGILKLDL